MEKLSCFFVAYTHRGKKLDLFQQEKRVKMRGKYMMKQKIKGKTNWKKVKSLTEKKIIASAKTDPDAPLLTSAQLQKFKRVNPTKKVDVKAVRNKLHLSQKEFANYFGVSVRTIQEWEQHRRTPTATARNFLRVIEKAPGIVHDVLAA